MQTILNNVIFLCANLASCKLFLLLVLSCSFFYFCLGFKLVELLQLVIIISLLLFKYNSFATYKLFQCYKNSGFHELAVLDAKRLRLHFLIEIFKFSGAWLRLGCTQFRHRFAFSSSLKKTTQNDNKSVHFRDTQ